MTLNIQWFEHNIKNEFEDSDIYTILNLYIDMLEICKCEKKEKSA
ncbi:MULTISPECIES: hypothetical protein [Bacillus cereus group]|nr:MULTISPECIES: hypothetical protein [Bacillus cereus group]EJR92642.1 hypothetical protein IKM_06161 [Bacillus mycoides]EJR94963.1 hypothetical protein IKO_05864 [Bacillus cereus VDM034]